LQLAGELRTALVTGQINVHYQPIARATDGLVVAAEALAQWVHPSLGRIPAQDFIAIAERSGLVHELTQVVLDTALAQVRRWHSCGLDIGVAVNLSPLVLRDLNWPHKVIAALARHGVPAHSLTLEVTETGIMSDPEHMIPLVDDLARAGVDFAIDDFGTGYSSLAYLQQLPVSKIKIDKSFVITMTRDAGAATIVRSVIELARSLDLAVVAEGVEDQRTLDHLIDAQCHFIQGYYLSRPIAADELAEWVRRQSGSRTAIAPHALPGHALSG
jgi:EAL domain-containing protein (putative c-di-GMP-specific phosphodiesterase class I)